MLHEIQYKIVFKFQNLKLYNYKKVIYNFSIKKQMQSKSVLQNSHMTCDV